MIYEPDGQVREVRPVGRYTFGTGRDAHDEGGGPNGCVLFYSVRGETLINLGVTYRGPIARRLGWELGVLYVEDIYFQVFSSWGNIWSFDLDGRWQVPFADKAANGRRMQRWILKGTRPASSVKPPQ